MDRRKALATVLQYVNDREGDDAILYLHMQRFRGDKDETVAADVRHRGGSRKNRRRTKDCDLQGGLQRTMRDYFSEDCAYDEVDFERRFRMPRKVFKRVYERMSVRPFFVRKYDALVTPGIHPLPRIAAALRKMAYGVAADVVDEQGRFSASSAMEYLKAFTRGVVVEFGAEYVHSPTATDLRRRLSINAARGSPGMVASIDCQNYQWKSCPTSVAGAHKGKARKPNVVLEGIADSEGWLWFMYFGFPGPLNDITVPDKSPTMDRILSGAFPRMEYSVNGVTCNLLYFLADGIYPDYAVFVKTISNGDNSSKDKNFSRAQEAVRKDVDRAFGIMITSWHVLERPIKLPNKEDI